MGIAFRPVSNLVPFPAEMPRRHYRVIEADPAWLYLAYSSRGDGTRSASGHYDVMTVDDLCRLPVGDLAHPDGCHLFLWATWPNILDAFRVAEAWGFDYSASGFVWVKTQECFQGRYLDTQSDLFMGLGHTTRKNTEPVLLFRKGEPRRRRKDVRELMLGPEPEDLEAVLGPCLDAADWPAMPAPRGRHSEKPLEIAKRIEAYAEGPYLELFSRTTRPGWDGWGNEAGRFDAGRLGKPAKVLAPEGLPLFGRVG